MKLLLVFAAAFLCVAPAYAETLITPSYVVIIVHNDPEGTVTSDNITYVGVNRKNGDTIKIKGRTLHTMEADGVTPNKFLGYVFENKKVSYFVGLNGTLQVTAGKKSLLDESGEWVD
jgi:hypothetical protein